MKNEKELLELEYNLICDFIKLRKDKNLSQKELANMSGVVREKITKIENRLNSPQINSLIKILTPLGYTLKIVPIEENKDVH